MPSKHSTLCRDVVILSVSFAFTIAVACFILFHNLNNHQQNAKQIEKIVEMILDGKVKHMMKEKSQAFERKHGNLNDKHEDTGRNKRAIHDFGVQTNGKITLLLNKFTTFHSETLNSKQKVLSLSSSIQSFDQKWRKTTQRP